MIKIIITTNGHTETKTSHRLDCLQALLAYCEDAFMNGCDHVAMWVNGNLYCELEA